MVIFQALNENSDILMSLEISLFAMHDLVTVMFGLLFIVNNRELKQPRRQWQQKLYKFAYLTMKNSIFARFARAFSFFWHFEDVVVLSTT